MSKKKLLLVLLPVALCASAIVDGAMAEVTNQERRALSNMLNEIDTTAAWAKTPVANTAAQEPGSAPGPAMQNWLPASVSSPNSPVNPFNLSPFGMLHYMWDDRTYVSSTNPMTQTDVRSALQIAQHDAQLAGAASKRARFASSKEQRLEAAAQARQYAEEAQRAANQASREAEEGSLNGPQVASVVQEQANRAVTAARQANASAHWFGF